MQELVPTVGHEAGAPLALLVRSPLDCVLVKVKLSVIRYQNVEKTHKETDKDKVNEQRGIRATYLGVRAYTVRRFIPEYVEIRGI